MTDDFSNRGFLPSTDPLERFPAGSPYAALDEFGERLPRLLLRKDFRETAAALKIPPFSDPVVDSLALARLYYVRLGFLASGYINQIATRPASVLPQNLARPLCDICRQLQRPPILSYDGYALYNWKRLDPAGPIALGNIDTIQNFVDLYDERWFILVHVEIEAAAAESLRAILELTSSTAFDEVSRVNDVLRTITAAVRKQTGILKRIPEHMSPDLYFQGFRPYIRFFDGVTYEGVDHKPLNFRGETGAQSSIMPCLMAFLKIRHRSSPLVNHLLDMRNYMPANHRALIERIQSMPDIRNIADHWCFNDAIDAIADFRRTHYDWAVRYVDERVDDPRGTGGTPFMKWLRQIIDETLENKLET